MAIGAPFAFYYRRLLRRSLSSLTALILFTLMAGLSPGNAHELRPAIADVTISGDRVDIEIRLALETLVADMDLLGLEDTNASPLSDVYDELRETKAEALEQKLREIWPEVRKGFVLTAGEAKLTLDIKDIQVGELGNIELARESVLHLFAELPADDSPVAFGWVARNGPLVVRQVLPDNDGYSGYLTRGELSEPMPRRGNARQSWLTAFTDYIGIGFQHIIPKGLDHILFVLGLFLFSTKLRPLLTQITAFTLAHTVTLASAAMGLISIPASIVEPLIAASIVYVAVENIFLNQLRPWRTALVFGFGLLHGLGFASVLGEIGLDPARFLTGLIGFNLGVELGQLTVIIGAYIAVGYWFGSRDWYRSVIVKPASLGIAIVGAYWFVERVFF